MCHTALLDAKFDAFLLRIDEDLGAETRARGCRRCGRRLHRDRYPRKPRGGPRNLREAYRHRLSFTCSICDKRHTPASVRFMGRRVYLAVTVVLAQCLACGGFEPLRLLPKDRVAVLGLVTTKSGQPESKDEIKRRIAQATKFANAYQLCLSPQCGFASTEEGNVLAEEEQWAKLRMIVEVADEVWA